MWIAIHHPPREVEGVVRHADGREYPEKAMTIEYWAVEDPETGDYICSRFNEKQKFPYKHDDAIAKVAELNARDYPSG